MNIIDELKEWLAERSQLQIANLNFNPYQQVLEKIAQLEMPIVTEVEGQPKNGWESYAEHSLTHDKDGL